MYNTMLSKMQLSLLVLIQVLLQLLQSLPSTDATICKDKLWFGFGVVVQNSKGDVVAGCYYSLPSVLPPIYAEAQALSNALNWWAAVKLPLTLCQIAKSW
uniref:RNase H type-1 domain-containing protein n=1 Tax=Cannabis sativa TaxID=3483 RepID=A0A803PM06_CANSA